MELIQQRLEKLKQKQKGFTLVELIVVIAIIGILAGVMLPKYFGFTDDDRKAAIITEAKSIRSIADIYFAKNDAWPTVAEDASNFVVGAAADSPTFTGTITKSSGSAPLSDGSFKYKIGTRIVTCDIGGGITGP
jgi:type IV pilus assembly protein PilA